MQPEEYLKYYSLGERQKFQQLSESAANKTYLVEAKNRQYILRIYDAAKTGEEVSYEHEVIRHLVQHNFLSPKPVPLISGDSFGLADQYFALFEHLPGHPLRGPEITSENIHSVGEVLGWFHLLLKDFQPNHKKQSGDLEGALQLLKDNKSKLLASNYEGIEDLYDELEAALKNMRFDAELPRGIVHSDMHQENVLFRHGEVSGVLDFDNCYEGQLIIDVATEIIWWCFRDTKFHQDFYRSFLRGYTSQRVFSKIEKEYFWMALKFSILKMVVRSLCFYYLLGKQVETYGAEAGNINPEYFREIYRECITNQKYLLESFPLYEQNL
ncbi:MAG: homoserine kinase [Patescibacteria group bacterium]|nr:homoserine kinase [Patescibacteria group bacterium]